jgi:hypothetical protein
MSFPVSTPSARLTHTALAFERSPACAGRGELEFDAEVAPGVTVTWDPATPRQCVAFSVEPDAGADVRPARPSVVADRAPWLRLAAVTMLDRRLHLTLNRSLLDAEIAAAQVGAARTLSPAEPVRDHLVDRALVRARRAARGLVQYLDRFTEADRRPPALLAAALNGLAGCYLTLGTEVDDHDDALTAAIDGVDQLSIVNVPTRIRRPVTAPYPSPSGAAQIDPRLVPARVLRMGPTADAAEIDVVTGSHPDRPALHVEVPAFDPLPEPADLAVRLIHRRSGRTCGYGLLERLDRFGNRCFACRVSLPEGVAADDVRVELFDAAGPPPEALSSKAELCRARRASLFLAGWRGLVADTRLWGARAVPAARLRGVIGTLAADASADDPLWAGGPALSHLWRLAGLGDRKLASLLRAGGRRATSVDGDDGGAAAVVDSVGGPGDLLAAELAAAYDRALPA